MKRLLFITVSFLLAQTLMATNDEPTLACVTVYWRAEGCGLRASSTGARLRENDCAVDPAKIPFGSHVRFEDADCHAVDSGPDVTNRKAARFCGRNSQQRSAIVIDRFFETKAKAMEWAANHPKFMRVWIEQPGSRHRSDRRHVALELNLGKDMSQELSLTGEGKRG